MPCRAVSKVRVALQRMEALEERVVMHDKHVGNLGILTGKAEGRITAQQRRQEQLDAMVHTRGFIIIYASEALHGNKITLPRVFFLFFTVKRFLLYCSALHCTALHCMSE